MSARSAISVGATSTTSAARPWTRRWATKSRSTFLENVPEGADAERSIEQLARTGHKLIFTTSFGFMDATLKVANKYPNVFFEHATGFKRAKNMSTYAARFYEGRYIQGQIAAKMSKTGIIGYIVSFPIPEVISNINATMLGAQSVNPNMKVKIIWVNSWFDPGKEADAAKALIDQGADILTQHTNSPAATQIAEQRGIHSFGESSDMIKFGPKAQLTADTDYWGGYYTKRAQDVLDGKWKSEDTWGGLDSGMVVMAPYTNMPEDVKKMAEGYASRDQERQVPSLQVPDHRSGRQDGRMQGRRPSRPRPDPEHELVRQRHRRQDSGEVIFSGQRSETGRANARPFFYSGIESARRVSLELGQVAVLDRARQPCALECVARKLHDLLRSEIGLLLGANEILGDVAAEIGRDRPNARSRGCRARACA